MAITAVTKVREFQIDTITNAGSESYYIYFDSYSSHAQMAIDCLGAVDPTTGTTTPSIKGQSLNSTYFPDAIVTGLNPFPREGQNLSWQLNVSYGEFEKDNESVKSGSKVFDKYPWERPKQYNWSHYFDQAIMAFDKDGKPLLNSAEDRFESDVIIDRTIRTVQITFATPLASFDPKATGDFINTINDSDVIIAGSVFPKKTLKCLSYDSSVQTVTITKNGNTKDILFNQSTVSLAYDPLTWDGIILDIGNRELGANSRMVDNEQMPYATPQRLNGGGTRLLQADGVTANGFGANLKVLPRDEARSVEGVMAFLKYKKYDETNLNRIGF